ncbi:Adenosylmethionine-8-amino-7-oxononanoate aminotransferase [Serinicoccus hydrothermalis]|uniref:Adenosylmethionine-8-amino-7-oxononanoate aminotransferase n=1 Tax=Serinicoccus hydrothermalis TaxID=1758689 RepID=A0A1B1NEL1_9MICO|nr:aminotransferase class III-fold pyridoxal phosphate-dependent enzyme [Serinicoccus hydrothermalis]ANS79880.1 Adenosylmethionine-8-amino-7-oxononanoate aminotransferase [Serinicoccus hydrothermalis]
MTITPDPAREARIKELSRAHVLTSWSAQAAIDPLPLAGGEGAYFWDHQGRRFLDFTSQLVNVNIGYQHPRLSAAVAEAAGRLTTVAPAFAEENRARAAEAIAGLAPEGMNKVFFTNGGAEANENALRMARAHTGRHKILAAYRSYHGATAGAITLTGEPRRWGAEPGMPGVVHFWGPHLYRSEFHASTPQEEGERALAHLRHTVEAEGPQQVAAVILETVVGSNGVLVPPPGYLEGVRELCDELGILLVLDEVMCGFGRTGAWFALDHWGVRPDLVTFAKGVNSGYVPLGGVIVSDAVAATFDERPLPGGLTYSGHALATASALAAIEIMREEGVVEHAAQVGERSLGPAATALLGANPLVGDVRGLGVFWAVELVADQTSRQPASGETMRAVQAGCVRRGMWPLIVANRVHLVPPCVISHEDADRGVAILADALADAIP